MKILGREVLEVFQLAHGDVRPAVESWTAEVEAANWLSHHDLKARYPTASILANNTVIFNIKGNNYRLEVQVAYRTSVMKVTWAGTHAEYSKR